MPYGRCIETWARERSIALIPPDGPARPGRIGLTSKSIELHCDLQAEKVAFFKTVSKKHKQVVDFRRAQNERGRRRGPMFSSKTAPKQRWGKGSELLLSKGSQGVGETSK